MSGTLLVPVQLQALLVNPKVRAQGFQRWSMDYSALATFTSPEPAPFTGLDAAWATDPANDGVHVQWTLPAALRRGTHDAATGATAYPLVPNRWLVVRLAAPAGAVLQRSARGWIVESDYLGPDGLSPYLDPNAPRPVPLRLGRVLPLDGWRAGPGRQPFLTAVAPGNVAFASYQPSGVGVFSFHDPATDLAEGQVVSYLVAGWYSDPAADILAPPRQPAGLPARLAELGWSVTGTESATKSVFHGAISHLTYSHTAVGTRPTATALAVGNSSIDAVTALVRARAARQPGSTVNPDLLEAFQYDLLRTLDDLDGPVELRTRIHEAWFAAQPGGSVWQVVDVPAGDSRQAAQQDSSTGEQDGAPAAQPQWLSELNRAQSAYDTAVRELATLQSRLYELWWKRNRANAMPQRPPVPADSEFAGALDPNRTGSLANQVLVKTKQVADAQTAIPWGGTQDALAAAITAYTRQHPLPAGTELKRAELPAFRSAADPVVVIAGAHAQSYDDELGTTKEGLLPCRFADQTVTGITVDPPPPQPPLVVISTPSQQPPFRPPPPRPITLTTAMMAAYLPTLNVSALDPVISTLLNELFFLDPVNAPVVALAAAGAVGRPPNPLAVLPAITQSMTTGEHMTGTVPAILPQPWSQPWAPLFLVWEVAYYPVPLNDANWQFDGTDYTCVRAAPRGGPIRLSGKSLLAPQPAFTMKARLDTYLATNPDADLVAVESFVSSVDGWDLLSQALSGFNAQLTLRDPASLRAPDARTVIAPPSITMASLIGRGALAMPLAGGAVGATAQPVGGSGFQTMRAGQFAFTRISVVDRFGQSLDVLTSANAATFAPALGEGLAPQTSFAGPAPTARYAQLPPRLLQGARLDAQFLPAASAPVPPGGTVLLDDPDAPDPICAWIVPSPLDRALACYSPEGAMLGHLATTAASGARVSWLPAPGSAFREINTLTRTYPVLGSFLSRLIGAGPAALADLLATIDAVLWTIDPPGSGDETHLAALAGRPLALARASVHCELMGPAPTDPTWPFTFAPPPPPPSDMSFPIRLGDARLRGDGLVGYLADPGDDRFYAPYVPSGLTSHYVQAIGPRTFLRPRFGDPAPTTVTLLLDPRAPVHLVSDVLPVATLRLPQRFVADALAAMALTVRVGPVLTDIVQQAGTAAPAVVLPRPPRAHGTWEWIEAQVPEAGPGAPVSAFDISPADAAARFPGTAPTVRSGWLKLSGGFTPPST